MAMAFCCVGVTVSQLLPLLQNFHTQLEQPLLSLYFQTDDKLRVVFTTGRS